VKKREKNKYDIDFDDEEISKILKSSREKGKKILGMDTEDEKEPYHPYYPISSSSDIYLCEGSNRTESHRKNRSTEER
jgi:hypothetical protein